MYPGLRKSAKNEVISNSLWHTVISNVLWHTVISNSLWHAVYRNWQKMKFAIFLKIHVPRSTEIGQK